MWIKAAHGAIEYRDNDDESRTFRDGSGTITCRPGTRDYAELMCHFATLHKAIAQDTDAPMRPVDRAASCVCE